MSSTIADSEQAEERIRALITSGGCIGFRTDTFYGLGVDPLNAAAVDRLRLVKGRDDGKPILILISDMSFLPSYISDPSVTFETIAEKFWPGPLTVIGQANSQVPNEITAGTGTIGVRLPASERVRQLVRACGGALTATSANVAGSPPATSAAEVVEYFGDKLDLIIDDGEVEVTEPSTVIDATQTPPIIIREGLIKAAAIFESLR